MSDKKKYRTWTVPQKLEIVLAGLRRDRSVAEVCRDHQIFENLYYTGRRLHSPLMEHRAGRPLLDARA